MSFWQRMQNSLNRMMIGRHGPDELSLALLIAGLVLSMLSRITRLALLDLIGIVAYVYAIYRIFSRQHEKRYGENQRFLKFFGSASESVKQFNTRWGNRHTFKYFKCPQCGARLRLPRKVGEVTVTCGKCKHAFKMKA